MSIYVWGTNKEKQLVGQRGDIKHTATLAHDPFDGNTPIALAAGDKHTLVLCESGELYSFGRNREGQLGHSSATCASNGAERVSGLENETIVAIGCGALNSYAITSTGDVYHWGLVYKRTGEDEEEESEAVAQAQAGQLTGIAADQDVVVEVDVDARLAQQQQQEQQQDNVGAHNLPVVRQARQLRDIVRDSVERWQLPTEDADREYYEELRAMGYENEAVEERMQERGREYHGMLQMDCRRLVQCVPQKVPKLTDVRIVAIAAGYAHTMLLSDTGHLYAAGYNDRGQLGLGHRISTSEFKLVDFLSNKFVVQVACGQQHTICRAIDRQSAAEGTSDWAEGIFVGSECGADVYVWGNGTLGQLGIGRRGTSKGRLFPTIVPLLAQSYKRSIVDVAAGGNFTVVVTDHGTVLSFGHAEYHQHGLSNRAYQDYVDAFHFYEPRPLVLEDAIIQPQATSFKSSQANENSDDAKNRYGIHIVSVQCGTAFTIALTDRGDIISWGWNQGGVLGHEIHAYAAAPSAVHGIGSRTNGCKVKQVACGGVHVVALTESHGNPWASSYHSVLQKATHCGDCIISVEGNDRIIRSAAAAMAAHIGNTDGGVGVGTQVQTAFPCHRAVLAARSSYLQGLLRAAQGQSDSNHSGILHITLPSAFANPVTVKSLLTFLYMDRIDVPPHKKMELMKLAIDLRIDRLAVLLSGNSISATTALIEQHQTSSMSFFVKDMLKMLNNRDHADVVFVMPSSKTKFIREYASDDEDVEEASTLAILDETQYEYVLYAHRFILSCRLPYYDVLLSSSFKESTNFVQLAASTSTTMLLNEEPMVKRKAVLIDISSLIDDGINLETFHTLMVYAYTGQFRVTLEGEEEDVNLNEIMSLLIASNRLGFSALSMHCERILSLHLTDFFPHNAQNCLEFAVAFNIPRLEKQCRQILRKNNN